MFKKLINWLNRPKCFIIADARDNSITFSKQLCKEMDVFNLEGQAKVGVFTLSFDGEEEVKRYVIVLNPPGLQADTTQLADIQYNGKFKCVGFECLVPTVNRIFYDYGIRPDIKVKLSVRSDMAGDVQYFEILKP